MPEFDDPCTADEAVSRALAQVARGGGYYQMGGGNYVPAQPDTPLQLAGGPCDCDGFYCWAWRLPRHRPGFNHGSWATVSDDINPNSAIEDADHRQELFTRVITAPPRPGDALMYPTFTVVDAHGLAHEFVGHVAVITSVPADFQMGQPWARLDTAQVCGPLFRAPAAVFKSGATFDEHDATWPVPVKIRGVDTPYLVRTRVIRTPDRFSTTPGR